MNIRTWIEDHVSYALAVVALTVDRAVTALTPKQFDEAAAQRYLDAADMLADIEENYEALEPLEHTDIARSIAELLNQAADKLEYWADIDVDRTAISKHGNETVELIDELRSAAHTFTAIYK